MKYDLDMLSDSPINTLAAHWLFNPGLLNVFIFPCSYVLFKPQLFIEPLDCSWKTTVWSEGCTGVHSRLVISQLRSYSRAALCPCAGVWSVGRLWSPAVDPSWSTCQQLLLPSVQALLRRTAALTYGVVWGKRFAGSCQSKCTCRVCFCSFIRSHL